MNINFDKEVGHNLTVDRLLPLLGKAFRYLEGLVQGAGSANVTVVYGGGSSGGSSGGGITTGEVAVGFQTVTVGANTITLPSTGLNSSDYVVHGNVDDGAGYTTPVPQPDTKNRTTFSYTNMQVAGTLYYTARLRT